MLPHLKYHFNFWTLLSALLGIILLLPVIFILGSSLSGTSENWAHFLKYLLSNYLFQTLKLMGLVLILSGIIGVGLAWLVSQFNFWGKSFFSWMLIMPLSIPTYVMAYAYIGIFQFAATQHWIPYSDYKSFGLLVIILSLALYPYVFTLCKTAFSVENKTWFEAAQTMGKSKWQIFFKVALPLSRTALVGGLSLVAMELLNDYGAVKYFGIDTLTVGIFRTWNSMGDLPLAIRLSLIVLLMVLLFLGLEKRQRGTRRKITDSSTQQPVVAQKLKGIRQIVAVILCACILILGFLLPVTQLIYWTFLQYQSLDLNQFFYLSGNTFMVSALTASITLVIGVIFHFSEHWHQFKLSKWLIKVSSGGYALPGAVIGIGVLIPALFIDHAFFQDYSLLNYSIVFLVFAFTVRFMAISNHSIENNFQKISKQLSAASKTMGKDGIKTLLNIHLPLSVSAISVSFLLVFVEVIKELPLTLMMRPFNFNTLSTQCFELANDEQVAKAGIYALVIILVGMIPILLLHQSQKIKP